MAILFPGPTIRDAVLNAIPTTYSYDSQQITAMVVHANQDLTGIEQYPLITVGYLEPTYRDTPLANLMDIDYDSQADELQYTHGIRVRQSVDINLYDNDMERCDSIVGDLALALLKADELDVARVFGVSPPRPLDLPEEGYLRRRQIELAISYAVQWTEIVNYIQTINTTTDVQQE